MVKDIIPEIRKNMQTIAKEEVEVEQLGQRIDQLEKKQDKDRDRFNVAENRSRRREKPTSNSPAAVTPSTRSSATWPTASSATKQSDTTLASLHDMQSAREKSLNAAREKLEAMLAQKRQLEVDVENLEARLKMVEVAQTTSATALTTAIWAKSRNCSSDLRPH